ncbi:MAG: hypothetical protein ABI591_02565 [Kofleriaceae bacterium]
MQTVVPTCLLLGVIAACHGSDPSAPDGSMVTDGSSSTDHGLAITWATSPNTIPGDTGGDGNSIATMTFRIANLRVIGDAGPGDNRTSIDSLELDWAAGATPSPVAFGDAPPGLYSHVILLADGNLINYSYELAGTTKLDGVSMPYQIHDRSPLAISLDTSAMLDPNETASLAITIRIDQALQSLDFHKLSNQNGTLVLDTFDNAMSDFRDDMMNSVFQTDHPQNN